MNACGYQSQWQRAVAMFEDGWFAFQSRYTCTSLCTRRACKLGCPSILKKTARIRCGTKGLSWIHQQFKGYFLAFHAGWILRHDIANCSCGYQLKANKEITGCLAPSLSVGRNDSYTIDLRTMLRDYILQRGEIP